MNLKQLLKKHAITEKQVELIRQVAKHPIFGALQPGMARILPSALRHGVVEKVWLDRNPPVHKTVTDTIPGSVLSTTTNEWYEPTARAVAFMLELEPGWTYVRPSDKWKT